ncbi:hypothetical protein GOBAR_AA26689 [Gossypium barbadense]|uniref:Uncharacterized protein n=1 Tax=Gossypium barbadense TaxID=3634 RepID=A0A2P5WSB6_GOSBA|nr:hypothetical protein GOBAR_AA26689 [Gossypium barbadense]
MIKLQARDSNKKTSDRDDYTSSFNEKLSRSTTEPCSSPCNDKNIHEERRLQIEELDEWRTQVKEKLRIHDESRQCHDKLKGESNQLKVGEKVLLDEADPHVATSKPNGAISFAVLNVFPYGTVEVTHSKFNTFKFTLKNTRGKSKVVDPALKKQKSPGTTSSSASPKVRHPYLRFSADPLEDLFQLLPVRPLGLGRCIDWATLEQVGLSDESMATGHIFGLAYFIALAFHHQTNRNRKGPICLGLYVTRLARHFGLFDTLEMSSTLTLVVQMFPQGISSMIYMRMIERRHGFDPPQYRLARSDGQDDPEDITENVPPFHKDPPPPPSQSHCPAAATLTDISEQLTCFEQQCFEWFNSIDATLRKICHHLHISPSAPSTHEASDNEDLCLSLFQGFYLKIQGSFVCLTLL